MFKISSRPSVALAIASLLAIAAVLLATTLARASVLTVPIEIGWNAISLPYEPVNGDPYSLFDELRPPAQTLDLLSGSLHRYDNDVSGYVTYFRQAPAAFGSAANGEGYWLWVPMPTAVAYQCVPPSSPPGITLDGDGWHMIGLPRVDDFPLAEVLVTNVSAGESKLFADAVAAQWVQSPLYRIDRADSEGNAITYTSLPSPSLPLADAVLSVHAAYWISLPIDHIMMTFDRAPSDLAAEGVSPTEVSLTWSDNSEYETGYEIERRIPPAGFQYIATLPANSSAYTDTTASPGTTYEYRVRGLNGIGATAYSNTASVTTSDSGPPTPIPVGALMDVAAQGAYAYVASYDYGVVVVDVGDPANPTGVGAATVGFVPSHLDVEGQLVVAAGGRNGAAIVDVGEPTAPRRMSSLSLPTIEVALDANYAYLIDTAGYLRVVDLWDPSDPVVVAELQIGGTPSEIALAGDYAYVAAGAAMLVIDVSVPSQPSVVTSLPVLCQRVAAAGDYAYIDGVEYGGIQVVDVRNPSRPTVVGYHQTLCMLNRFVVQVDKVYAAFRDFWGTTAGLRIIDVSTPSAPFTTRACVTPGIATGVAAGPNCAYVADGVAGLQVIDVSDPSHPFVVGSVQ